MDPLLTEETTSDLLPTNTQVFPSSYRFPFFFWVTLAGGSLLSLILIAVGGSTSGSTQAGTLTVGIIILVTTGIALFVLYRRSKLSHEYKIRTGEWYEGVIVFPNGNVVIRLNSLCWRIDLTIESVYLSRVDVAHRFNFAKCGRTQYLKFYYSKLDSTPGQLAIPAYCFVDNLERIAQYVNEVKVKEQGRL
eukprot:gb/GECG01014457.1/.p1 GENE.gb/GECG01014457.1/~~gb/GECG01014457.1/.p1  ORF type:complete len:191 (+),score=4.38 gb/GECG01014457.1/:1-573(+)